MKTAKHVLVFLGFVAAYIYVAITLGIGADAGAWIKLGKFITLAIAIPSVSLLFLFYMCVWLPRTNRSIGRLIAFGVACPIIVMMCLYTLAKVLL